MTRHCSHQWKERSASLRELLRNSEYGGWRVDCYRYFVCANCLEIKSRPRAERYAFLREPAAPCVGDAAQSVLHEVA